ncbi:MAG: hypothetical protein KDB82_01140 [Planctomycetes bacterium]|nr:hypothetical protein [Planctomycetota bacterium]
MRKTVITYIIAVSLFATLASEVAHADPDTDYLISTRKKIMTRHKITDGNKWVQGAFDIGTIPDGGGVQHRYTTTTGWSFKILGVGISWVDRKQADLGFLSFYRHNLEIKGEVYMKPHGAGKSLSDSVAENLDGSMAERVKKVSNFSCTGNTEGGSEYYWQCYTYLNLNGTVEGGDVQFSFSGTWAAMDLVGTEHNYHLSIASTPNGGSSTTSKEWAFSGEATQNYTTTVGGSTSGVDLSGKVAKGLKVATSYTQTTSVTTPTTAPIAINNYEYRVTTRGYLDQAVGEAEDRERWVGASFSAIYQNTANATKDHTAHIKTMRWGTEVVEMIIEPYMGTEKEDTPKDYHRPPEPDEPAPTDKDQDAVGDPQDMCPLPTPRSSKTYSMYVDPSADGSEYQIDFYTDGPLDLVVLGVWPVSDEFDAEVTGPAEVSAVYGCRIDYRVSAQGTYGAFTVNARREGGMPSGFENLDVAIREIDVEVEPCDFIIRELESWPDEEHGELLDSYNVGIQPGISVFHADFGGALGDSRDVSVVIIASDIPDFSVEYDQLTEAGVESQPLTISASGDGTALVQVTVGNRSIELEVSCQEEWGTAGG